MQRTKPPFRADHVGVGDASVGATLLGFARDRFALAPQPLVEDPGWQRQHIEQASRLRLVQRSRAAPLNDPDRAAAHLLRDERSQLAQLIVGQPRLLRKARPPPRQRRVLRRRARDEAQREQQSDRDEGTGHEPDYAIRS